MSLPTTTTATRFNAMAATKTYSGRDKACECFISLYVITLLTAILCATPAITRLLIILQPNIPDFTVDSSTLSVINVSSTSITADWNLTLSATNPNKNSMSYDHISALALRDTSLALSTASILPFRQKGFRREIVEAKFAGMVVGLPNCTTSCGLLSLTMEFRASASYGGWTWPLKRDRIKVVCGGFEVDFPLKVTSLTFRSSNCSVNGKWKRMVEKCRKIFWNYIFVTAVVVGILALSL